MTQRSLDYTECSESHAEFNMSCFSIPVPVTANFDAQYAVRYGSPISPEQIEQ